MTTLHAHISTAQSDCDGPTYDSWVVTFNEDERNEHIAATERGYNDFSEYSFKERILGNAVSFHGNGQVNIHPDGFNYFENTDEGYRSAEVRWCEDDCDTNERTHRDVFAEQMGY